MDSTHWNFRGILDLYPDSYSFTCVGRTQEGKRCGNQIWFLAAADLSKAARMLDDMDNLTSLKSSFPYLEELASLTLCKRWHHDAQTEQVSMRWKSMIREYARDLKRERERVAALRTKRQLADMKVAALKLENKENAPPAKFVESEDSLPPVNLNRPVFGRPGPLVPRPGLEDPFIDHKILKYAKPNPFGTAVFGNATYGNPAFGAATSGGIPFSFGTSLPSKYSDRTTSEVRWQDATATRKMKSFEGDVSPILQSQATFLPSPPDTPLSSRWPDENKITEETLPTPLSTKPKAPSPSSKPAHNFTSFTENSAVAATRKTNFAFEFGSQSSRSMDTIIFELPAEVDTPAEQHPNKNLSNESQASTSALYFGSSAASTSNSFDFNIPRKSSLRQKVPRLNTSMPWHNTVPQEVKSPIRDANNYTFTSSNQSMDQDRHQVSPLTPVKTSSMSGTGDNSPPITYSDHLSAQLTTPPQQSEESFGYAVVTPSSTRYSTYLPARQQHGLFTPPETPEKFSQITRAPITPPRDADYFTSPLPSLAFTIPRKPLPQRPSHSLKRRDEVRWISSERVRVCHICRAPQDTAGGGCACAEEKKKIVNVGCLESLGLSRLREKATQRMKAVKERVSGRRNSEPVNKLERTNSFDSIF